MNKKFFALLILIVIVISAVSFAYMQSSDSKDKPLTTAVRKTGIKIIDIRTEPEWVQTGIVKDSYTLTFFDKNGGYDAGKFLRELDKIVGKSETFGIICRTGNRTTTVAKFLREQGYTNVINFLGGVTQAAKNGVEFEPYKK